MLPTSYRISRVQKTLEWFEQDIPFLNMRVKDLSVERQKSAKRFAAAVISETRAELKRLLKEQSAQKRVSAVDAKSSFAKRDAGSAEAAAQGND
jgi:hypothetical protein